MQRTNHAPPPTIAGEESAHDQANGRWDPGPSPSVNAETNDMRDRLREQVEALPERQRELLYLKIHGHLSYREIAEATGLSVSNVGYLLHQAMQTLRRQLSAADA